MAAEPSDSGHSALCLRLMQLLPHISRGLRRSQDRAAPQSLTPLGPRHVTALEQLREGPLTVGTLAARLDLKMSTVSGVLADLERADFIIRQVDEGDRRRTIVQITPAKNALIEEWLDGAARPLAGSSTAWSRRSRPPSSRPWTCSKQNYAPKTPNTRKYLRPQPMAFLK